MLRMKHKKEKKSKHEKKKSKRDDRKHKKQKEYDESDSSSNSSGDEEEWVEKPTSESVSVEENSSISSTDQKTIHKRDDWMDLKSIFPCVFNEKKSASSNRDKNADKPDLDKLGQSNRELNPYWRNGGDGLPAIDSMKTDTGPVMDANWLKKSLRRAQEQAEHEGKSLEDVAAERWGSLEAIQEMIYNAERTLKRNKSDKIMDSSKESRFENQSRGCERYESNRFYSSCSTRSRRGIESSHRSRSRSQDRHKQHKNYDSPRYEKQQKHKYKKPMDDDCSTNTSYKMHSSSTKKWQRAKIADKTEESQFDSDPRKIETISIQSNSNSNKDGIKSTEIKPITEAEMNKLGAKIVKAEIMGNTELAAELKNQLKRARELTAKAIQLRETDKVQDVILTHTDNKGITRPLQSGSQSTDSSRQTRQKNLQTHVSGKRVRHYVDDDKYTLQQLFEREKGRSVNEDDATFVKIASKNMDMDDIFEEQITRTTLDRKQDDKNRSLAIKEHKQLSRNLDSCRWCIDSEYMLKHMIVSMDSEICLSLPHYTSLTDGHCILTPIQHVACQLQLDENIWERLKIYKRVLYKMFMDQNQYPVFYEIYKSRHKFPHMQLECIPLPKEIGESAPMYFKKALLECETEWSMNKKIVDLEHKDVRQAIPNGLSYFAVEFERNKGYAHVIEDEHMFPKNFAEEIIGGMLDLDHDVWRKPKKENFDRQREKVLKFSKIWEKYDSGITDHA